MANVKETVLKIYKNVLEEMKKGNSDVDVQNKVGRESGLDSISFVNLIVGIEEELGINLDPVLIALRNTKSLQEVIDIVSQLMNEKAI